MQITYVITGKPDRYASLKLRKYSECSENVTSFYRVNAEKADHLRYSLAQRMSIVCLECSIEMYYTKRSGGRSSEERDTQKRVVGCERCVSLQKIIICHFASLPPGPLDTKSVVSRPVPIMILLSGRPLSTAGRIPTRA